MNRLHHLALLTTDVERLAAFYRDFFGLAEVARHADSAGELRSIWLDLGGPLLMIERGTEPSNRQGGVVSGLLLFAVTVSRAERVRLEAELSRRGVPLENRTAFSSYARDPDGNRFAFSHYPEAEIERA